MSVAAQMNAQRGAWRFEMNGSGAMNSLLSAKPRHLLGHFDDYLFRANREQKPFATDLRFGILTPSMYANSEFLNLAFPQQGFEGALRTSIGSFAVYNNAQGQGESAELRQRLQGASDEAPLPKARATLRLMIMRSRDAASEFFLNADENSPFHISGFNEPKNIDALGALLLVPIKQKWNWATEYAMTVTHSSRLENPSLQGRAFRTGIGGNWQKTTLNLSYREVTPNYLSPAGAALSPLNNSDRRGVDASVIEQTSAGAFTIIYQFLQSDLRSTQRPVTSVHNLTLNWSKSLNKHTAVVVGGNLARTKSGSRKDPEMAFDTPTFFEEANHRRVGLNASVTETFNKLTVTVSGSRNWFRDRINRGQSNIVSSLNLSSAWMPRRFFQMQTNVSVNWFAGDKLNVGGNRVATAYIQPSLNWQSKGLSFLPLLTLNQMKARFGEGIMTSDLLTLQYGGRITWRAPGRLQFNTFSLEASRTSAIDKLFSKTITTPRLLVLWTLVQPATSAN